MSFLEPNKVSKIEMDNVDLKLMRIGTIGDGSCFFHSICLAIDKHKFWDSVSYKASDSDGRKSITKQFRKLLSEEITASELDAIFSEMTNKVEKPTLEKFKKDLEKPKKWANEPMIRYTAKKLNKNIIFLNMTSNQMFCNVHHPDILKNMHCTTCDALETIVVAWVQQQHFELIGLLIKIDSKNIHIEPLIKEQEIIKKIMENYFKQCNIKKL